MMLGVAVCVKQAFSHIFFAVRYRSSVPACTLTTNRVLEALLELGQDLSNVPVAMGPEPVLYSYALSGTTHCVVCIWPAAPTVW
jgi:hypothetical protein